MTWIVLKVLLNCNQPTNQPFPWFSMTEKKNENPWRIGTAYFPDKQYMTYEGCIPELVVAVPAACHTVVKMKPPIYLHIFTNILQQYVRKTSETANRITLQEQNFSVQFCKYSMTLSLFSRTFHDFSWPLLFSMTFQVQAWKMAFKNSMALHDFPGPVGTLWGNSQLDVILVVRHWRCELFTYGLN